MPSSKILPREPRLYRAVAPPPELDSLRWLPAHVRMPPGLATKGGYDFDLFPHHRGPCEAFDGGRYREIALQWGTRLGKSVLCASLVAEGLAVDGAPALFASVNEKLAKRTVKKRLYPILANSPLGPELPPEHRRPSDEIEIGRKICYVGWAGSSAMVADIGAKFGWANEYPKWPAGDVEEGDPGDLFGERGKDYPDRRFLYEGSPQIAGRCRLERLVKEGTNCRYWVPCPHCGERQVLRRGEKDLPGGLRWEKAPDGRSDPDLAYATAWYECDHCGGRIENRHRPAMMRAGVWAPEGCHVTKKGRVAGKPRRPRTRTWSGQLSSLYSLLLTWGDYAEHWIRSVRRGRRSIQNHVNGWDGETWRLQQSETTAEAVARRLGTDRQAGIVPAEAAFLTAAADVQATHIAWMVCAWAAIEDQATGWVVDYGLCDELDDLVEHVLDRRFEREGGGHVAVRVLLADTGYKPEKVSEWCRRQGKRARPIKGADLRRPFSVSSGRVGRKKKTVGILWLVDNAYYQDWVQAALDDGQAGRPGALHLCSDAAADDALLEDLLNEAQVLEVDKAGREKLVWQKVEPGDPNDWRDTARYCRCAADMVVRLKWKSSARAAAPRPQRRRKKSTSAGGRVWQR